MGTQNSRLWELLAQRPAQGQDIWQSGVLRDRNDFLGREMRPLFVIFQTGLTFRTNRWGMRDRDYDSVPPPRTRRIALLGQSYVAGDGVTDGATFEALAEDRLNAEGGDGRTEILNFAVGSYSVPQQLAILPRVLSFDPDVVMLVANQVDPEWAARHLVRRLQRGVSPPHGYLRSVLDRAGVTDGPQPRFRLQLQGADRRGDAFEVKGRARSRGQPGRVRASLYGHMAVAPRAAPGQPQPVNLARASSNKTYGSSWRARPHGPAPLRQSSAAGMLRKAIKALQQFKPRRSGFGVIWCGALSVSGLSFWPGSLRVSTVRRINRERGRHAEVSTDCFQTDLRAVRGIGLRVPHVLKRYENGLEKCMGCSLCAGACPADAIFVEASENTDEKRFSPGERYASTYEINMLRCIYCGYCEEACPTEAIVLGDNYELSFTSRAQAIYPKEMLLEPVPDSARLTPQKVKAGVFNRSVPEMKDSVD